MEQYWIPKELDFENLRKCLDNYEADSIFVRLKGSSGGEVKLKEDLTGKVLDFKKDDSGLYLSINSEEVFHFPLKNYEVDRQKGFSLAYERVRENGSLVMLSRGIDPYDSELPEPKKSFLRHALDDHLFELYFKGRVDLEFHSWWDKPHFKYWNIK
ncbi:hypothetical protein HOD61_00915 [archaeon]|jgi:hypothetical protein|nr:hypothetical protein [archaeon]